MSINMKKLREKYDRLYLSGESLVKAWQDWQFLRTSSKGYDFDPKVDEAYRRTIRPYWRQFKIYPPAKLWFHRYCTAHKAIDPKYIPDSLWHRRIIPHYNDLTLAKAWQDKCMQNVFIPSIRRPETVIKNISGEFYDDALTLLTLDQAVARCRGRGRILVKPSVGSGGGYGIRFFDSNSLTDQQILDIFRLYGRNFIIQEKAAQHEALARLNPGSLNTIRVVTFLYQGQVRILSTILRVGGQTSEVDNISQGGFQCTIRSDGRLEQYGYTHAAGSYKYVETYPNGIRFQDVTIPSFDRILDAVTTQAAKMAHFRIIGWDIAVSPEGEPILIEFNVIPALNQETDGPVFGELTDQILEEVFGRR